MTLLRPDWADCCVPMRIDISLESEGPLNPEEALGHISITGDDGAEIQSRNIWVDDWLAALLEGVQALSRGQGRYAADIVTESYPLIFKSSGQSFSISFAGATVTGYDFGKFQLHLKTIIRRVLDEFEDGQEMSPGGFWVLLERYSTE